jgi:hypothetical protein
MASLHCLRHSSAFQGCLKLLSMLLRHCPDFTPPTARLRRLVAWAFTAVNLADAAARPQMLGLLRAILDRKMVSVVEVYDVMVTLQVQFSCLGWRSRNQVSSYSVCSVQCAIHTYVCTTNVAHPRELAMFQTLV